MRYLVALLAVGLLAGTAHATILVQESFTHPDGNLVGQTPEIGGTWAAHSGAGAKPIQVASGKITVVQSTGSGEDDNTSFAAMTGGKYYAGFDLIQTGGSADQYFAHFNVNATTFYSRVFITNNSLGDYTLGLSNTSTIGPKWADGLVFGTNYRVIVSYEFATGVAELWVNPASEASTKLTATGTASAALAAFAFRQSSPSPAQAETIDNLLVGTSFAEVLPEPASLGLMVLGGLAVLRRKR